MKILFLGDIFGRPGREGLQNALPKLRKEYKPDVVGANVENLAHGHGLTKEALKYVSEAGVDFFTSGNHIWEGRDSKELLQDDKLPLARPANYPPGAYGKGFFKVPVGTRTLLVINLMGRVFMKNQIDCPFRKADEILAEFCIDKASGAGSISEMSEGEIDAVFVDFHAEATSEKKVLGFYLDGRISGLVGTHTHVPTADEQILLGGTGYLTDAGMCGVTDSSIGLDKDAMIKEMLTQVPQKKDVAEGMVEIGGVLMEIGRDGKCRKIKRIREFVD